MQLHPIGRSHYVHALLGPCGSILPFQVCGSVAPGGGHSCGDSAADAAAGGGIGATGRSRIPAVGVCQDAGILPPGLDTAISMIHEASRRGDVSDDTWTACGGEESPGMGEMLWHTD